MFVLSSDMDIQASSRIASMQSQVQFDLGRTRICGSRQGQIVLTIIYLAAREKWVLIMARFNQFVVAYFEVPFQDSNYAENKSTITTSARMN